MITRRSLFAALASLPVVGKLARAAAPEEGSYLPLGWPHGGPELDEWPTDVPEEVRQAAIDHAAALLDERITWVAGPAGPPVDLESRPGPLQCAHAWRRAPARDGDWTGRAYACLYCGMTSWPGATGLPIKGSK